MTGSIGTAPLPATFVALALLLAGYAAETLSAPPPRAEAVHTASAMGRIDVEGGLIRLVAQRDGVVLWEGLGRCCARN